MKESEIRFKVELDQENIPEKIFWYATDGASEGLEEAKAITISVWDHVHKETLRIDLWGKEMPVDEMKRFYIDTIGGLANSLRSSTSDLEMADEIDKLCERMLEIMSKKK
jgi:gliding motility-associated protein GldC